MGRTSGGSPLPPEPYDVVTINREVVFFNFPDLISFRDPVFALRAQIRMTHKKTKAHPPHGSADSP
jgi:hypothetical protein